MERTLCNAEASIADNNSSVDGDFIGFVSEAMPSFTCTFFPAARNTFR